MHCPYFPENKQEYWWTYVSDRKNKQLVTAPYLVTNLVRQEECQLQFTAPRKPGHYKFTVCLRADSFIGFDQMREIKVSSSVTVRIPVCSKSVNSYAKNFYIFRSLTSKRPNTSKNIRNGTSLTKKRKKKSNLKNLNMPLMMMWTLMKTTMKMMIKRKLIIYCYCLYLCIINKLESKYEFRLGRINIYQYIGFDLKCHLEIYL